MEEIESNYREHGRLLLKELTWSNLSLIRIFKIRKLYIINKINTNIWEKIF